MTLSWKQWLAIGGACAASTQIGTGLKAVTWLVGVPEVAYAARAKAETVDDQFHEYLAQQDATMKAQQAAADAVNAYIQQQQQPKTIAPVPAILPTRPTPQRIPRMPSLDDDKIEVWIEHDAQGTWCCTVERCWACE